MSNTEINLFRSVRAEAFPKGTVIEGKPAPEVLYPDFEPRMLPNGKKREADVILSEDKAWIYEGGGTSLFDRPDVFKRGGWLAFHIPAGTEVPESLVVRYTGRNPGFDADHYQIESKAHRMRLDAYKGALDNLARNAIVKSIELAERGKRT